jgi:preprotein translocase subunit SecE
MARDRKRAKQRQRQRRRTSDRQPAPVSARREIEETPEPLEHASAEVEIAEAAMAGALPPAPHLPPGELPDEAVEAEAAEEEEAAGDYLREESPAGAAAVPARLAPGAELPAEGTRLGNFLRACAAELRRVQWPDRRQVAQATGVVLGFVIIAGAYLGVLDAIFSRLIKAIL